MDRRVVAASSVPAGPQVLDGEHALTFVRSRRFPDGDFTRMQHQQLFLQAFSERMTSPEMLPRIPQLVEIAAQHVTTDMTVAELVELAAKVESASDVGVEAVSAPGRVGRAGAQSVVYLDDDALKRTLAAFMAGSVSDPGSFEEGSEEDPSAVPGGELPAYPRPE